MNGSCSPKDLETLLQLVYLSFTAPRMDQNAFESYKSRTKAALANQEANPQIALSDSLQKAMYMNHPRALRVKADMIDKIDYKRIMEMYKDRFKDAGDFTFLFVGNITLMKPNHLLKLIWADYQLSIVPKISAIQNGYPQRQIHQRIQ